jgi:hypothetical protein
MPARNRCDDPLLEIHRVQPIAPFAEAPRARREPFEIPEVDEHSTALAEARKDIGKALLDFVEGRRREEPRLQKSIHRAISRTRRNQ